MQTTHTTKSIVMPYNMKTYTEATSCSSYVSYFEFVRDAAEDSWEAFTTNSLSSYVTKGIQKLSQKITQLENLALPYTEEQAAELVFMVESLTHARILLSNSAV